MPGQPDRTASRLACILLWLSALWASAIVAAPWVTRAAPPRSALLTTTAGVYLVGAAVCHQRPERSFHVAGVQWPVCARCAGLYAGAGAAAWLVLLLHGRSRIGATLRRSGPVLILAAAPTAIAWLGERAGVAAPGNLVRAALAVPLGSAVCWVVAVAWQNGRGPAEHGVN